MLKGFNFIGIIPEHIVKTAHLDVSWQCAVRHRTLLIAMRHFYAWRMVPHRELSYLLGATRAVRPLLAGPSLLPRNPSWRL